MFCEDAEMFCGLYRALWQETEEPHFFCKRALNIAQNRDKLIAFMKGGDIREDRLRRALLRGNRALLRTYRALLKTYTTLLPGCIQLLLACCVAGKLGSFADTQGSFAGHVGLFRWDVQGFFG